MAQQLRLAEGRAAAAEEARQRQQEEAAFLRRGIDLAAEQLTKSGAGEVPAALLVSLARVGMVVHMLYLQLCMRQDRADTGVYQAVDSCSLRPCQYPLTV